MHVEVVSPMYDFQNRKYIDLRIHGLCQRVKVPFRYNRVMCSVEGIVPLQDIPPGTHAECIIEIRYGTHVLVSFRPLP